MDIRIRGSLWNKGNLFSFVFRLFRGDNQFCYDTGTKSIFKMRLKRQLGLRRLLNWLKFK